MNRLQRTLHNHVVVCGYGHSGQSAAQESVARGIPAAQILVIDRDAERLQRAAAAGYAGLLGDPTREQDLLDAGIDRAQAVLICLGRDDAAVLTALTVRQLNPRVRMIVNVAEEENIKLLRQAGADAIVAPSIVGGHLMADSVSARHIADYIADLMSAEGPVRLHERPALPGEVGLHVREIQPSLVVRLHRGEQPIGFWEGERARVQAGDVLLVIEANAGVPLP